MKKLIVGLIGITSLNAGLAQCPTASFTTSAPECRNQNVSFNNTSGNTGGGWNYQWDFDFGGNGNVSPQTSGSQNPNGIQYNGGGAYTVSFTITGNGCPTTTATMIVDIKKARADFGISGMQVCLGETVDFFNTGSTQGTGGNSTVTHFWDFGAGASPATSTVENPGSVTYSTTGAKNITHYVTVTLPSCGRVRNKQVSQTITVNPTPAVTFTSTAPVCEGVNVDFTYSGTTSSSDQYNWDFGAGSTPTLSTTQNPMNISYSSNGTKVVSLTVTNQYGCFSTGNQNIVINQTPIADFATTAPVCTGLATNFTNMGTTGASYSWNFGSGASPLTSVSENPSGVVYATAGNKIITLTTLLGTCSSVSTQAITIHQTPAVSFTSNAPQCANTGVNLTNTGSTGNNWSYTWDLGLDAQPSSSNSENPMGITYNTGGSKTITFTISDQFCTSTNTQSFNINPSPVADFATTTPVCTGLGADFTNMGTTGASYSWSFGSGSSPLTSTLESPSSIVYSTAGNKVITLTTTLGTCTDVSTQAIIIHQTPAVSFTSTSPQCVNTAVNLTNTGSTGNNWSYTWDLGMDAQPASSNSENPVGVLYTSGGSKTITFTISDQFCTSTNTQSFNINSLPVMDAGADTTICANTSVQIGSAAITGTTYQWFPSNTVVIDNAIISNPTVSPISTFSEFIVSGIDGNGCMNSDTVIVTMLNPLVADAGVDVEICRYDSIQVGASIIQGQLYTWSLTNGLADSISSNTMVSPDSTTTYTLSVTNDYGCATQMDQVTVIVNQLPIANAGIDDSTTVNSSVQLVATGGVQYAWWPEMGLSNAGINNPLAIPDSTTEYVVTVIDIYGCIQTDTMTVTVIIPSFWLPNAFTPDDDLMNDIFYVRGDGVTDFQFLVFDQWGHLIFKSKDMTIGWDGSYATGEKLPKGAYVYHVSGTLTDGTLVNSNGLVNLIR